MTPLNLIYPPKFLFLLLFGLLTSQIFAQPGTLDNRFGNKGKITISIDTFNDMGNAILILENEKILVAGSAQENFQSALALLMQFNTDGSLDTSFGDKGRATSMDEKLPGASSMAIQSDGKIVLGSYFNLVRFNKNGVWDTTFGSSGKASTVFDDFYNLKSRSIAIQKDGKIIQAGHANATFLGDKPYFLLARFHANGIIDSSFGTDGKVIGNAGRAEAMRLQDDGKIVLAGNVNLGSGYLFTSARFNTDGTADSSYGKNGVTITSVGLSSQAFALHIQKDKKILLGGHSNFNNGIHSALVRYHSNGILDSTFGIDGKVQMEIGSRSEIFSLGVQSDGKIVSAGYVKRVGSRSNFALTRYHANGTLDSAFGLNGNITNPSGEPYSYVNDLSISKDEKILLAGNISNDSTRLDIQIARYHGDATVTVEEFCCQRNSIKIFPNPFSASATIYFNELLHEAHLTLFNSQGQIIRKVAHISGHEVELSRNHLPKGIYFLQLSEKNKVISVNKLIIGNK